MSARIPQEITLFNLYLLFYIVSFYMHHPAMLDRYHPVCSWHNAAVAEADESRATNEETREKKKGPSA